MSTEEPGAQPGSEPRESVPRRPARPVAYAWQTEQADRPVWHLPDADPADPASWEARIRGIRAALTSFAEQAGQLAAAERASADRTRAEAHRAAEEAAERERSQVGGAVTDALAAASSVASSRATTLAPGLGSQPYGAAPWQSPELVGVGMARYVRIGTYQAETPMIVPITGQRGWQIWADLPAAAHQLVQNIVLRLVGTAEPLRVRVDSYDPKLAGSLGLFGRLQQRAPAVMPPPVHAPDALTALLADLVATSSRRGARLTQHGFRSFAELAAASSRSTEPYRVLALLDYPAGIDAHAQRELVRVASTADARGLCLLVHHDPDIAPERGVDPAELLSLLQPAAVEADDRLELDQLEDLQITVDPPPGTAEAGAICDAVADLVEQATLPTVDFIDTLPDERDWWQPVTDELSTVVGYADELPATIRLRSANPPLPNVLVGGAVGSGKSNLLHNLVHGLAVRYAPTDLEMYLLDFKQGIEFAALGPTADQEHWLPHVRVLGVHSDRPFGLAVLRYLAEELERRSDVFKGGQVTDIAALPPGGGRPPRILVVLDEFQVLFEEDSSSLADDAVRLLEQLVRQGRAYGIHVVLATQSLAGIQRMAIKRDSIFGQVPYRVVLKTTPTDSQSMLQLMNTSAAELQFRGEAILNDGYGAVEHNRRVLVSFADKPALDRLRRRLWQRSDDDRPPRIFQFDEPAKLTMVGSTDVCGYDPEDESHAVWLGMPISVAEDPVVLEVRPEPGAGLAVLGDGPADALGVLSGVAYSIAANPLPGTRFVLLDLLPAGAAVGEGKAALEHLLHRLGFPVTVVGRDDVDEQLVALRDLVRSEDAVDGPVHVLGLGLHRATKLVERQALGEVVTAGPAAGVFTYAWWNRLHVCTNQLGMNRADLNAYLFLRHPADGVRKVCGPQTQWASQRFRGLFWDGLQESPTVVVPFAPFGTDDVDRLTTEAVK